MATKKAVAEKSKSITAYCVKTKKKNVPMVDPVIEKTAKGGYMAKGEDADGNKMVCIMSEATALAHIKAGTAKKGY